MILLQSKRFSSRVLSQLSNRFSILSRKLPIWVSGYALPTGIVLLFLLLWIGSQSVNSTEHNQYVGALRQLQEQDARVNQSLLQLRLGLVNNYDSIVNQQAEIQAIHQALAVPPSFVGANRQPLQAQVQESQQLWQAKDTLIEQFNSKNSVLRNSLTYFPIAVEALSSDPTLNPELAAHLNALLRNILLFNLSSTAESTSKAERDIEQINRLSGTANKDVVSALTHANIILEQSLETDKLIEQALRIPTRQQGQALTEAYDSAYQRAVGVANLCRFGLYLLLTAVVVAIAASIISKLRNAVIAQQQSENTQQALFQAIPDLMLRMYKGSAVYDVVSPGRSVVLLNPHKKRANLNDILPQAVARRRLAAVKEALDTRSTQAYEQTLKRASQTAWEEVRVVPCGEKDVLVMIRDISDRKQAEIALHKATAEARVANKAKSQFLSNMSHELRTPLNVILGFAQLMARDSALNLQQQDYLDSINQSGEHLLNLINDILEMSKIEAGKVSLNPHDFDLYGLLEGIHTMFQFKAHSKGLALALHKADDLPQYVFADESKLRQVLVNLVGNAVKFTHVGGIQLRVSLGISLGSPLMSAQNGEERPEQQDAQQDLVTLHFEVEDTGPGVSAEDIKVLFDPFVQVKNQAIHVEGTGLGLPISRKFVEMMGGEIALASQVGVGSQFVFSVNAKAASDRSLLFSKAHQTVIGLAANQPSHRILVVEDGPKNRQLLVDLLSPVGFEIKTACDGLEAVNICESWRPALVWMDIRMPIMDGYEATRQIKSQANSQQPIVIALTGNAFISEQQRAIAAGCDDFVCKPFRTETIFEKIAEYLGVQYLYSEPAAGAASLHQQMRSNATPQLTAEDLQTLSSDWIAQIHRAATKVNGREIVQLLEALPPEQETIRLVFRRLVENFSFEEIVNLTRTR